MVIRTLSRWMLSIAFAVLALVAINLLVTASPTLARHASLINCSGSIQACIDAANEGDTILIAPGRYTESLTLNKPVSLTGENRDTTILHAVSGQRVLTVTGATISNSVVISGLTFTGGNADQGGGIYAYTDVSLIVQNARFTSNTANGEGGGLYAGGAVTLTKVDFSSNTAPGDGGGIYLYETATVNNSRFENNLSGGNGGGFYAKGFTSIATSDFISNTASSDGGGVYIYEAATVVDKSRFENNSSGGNGGGLYAKGTTSIATSDFISNAALSDGGGAYFESDVAAVENARVERNSSGYQGGGFYASGFAHISGTSFISNVARSNALVTTGGGLWANAAIVTNSQFLSNSAQAAGGMKVFNGSITGSRFEGNVASLFSGGGLEAFDISITDTDFYNNSAMAEGGGAYLLGPVHVIERASVRGNQAALDGGGLYIGGPFQMINTQLSDNIAGRNGGAIWQVGFSYLQSSLTNVLFADNLAEGAGSAIFMSNESGPGSVELQHATLTDRALNSSSAIAILTSTLYLTNTIIASHTIAISNTGGTVFEDYNLFFNNITNTLGVTNGGHSLIGDPKFVDPLHGNYHLLFGSAAIDHGIDAGVYTDLDGHPRPSGTGFDIGAYEYTAITYRIYLPIVLK